MQPAGQAPHRCLPLNSNVRPHIHPCPTSSVSRFLRWQLSSRCLVIKLFRNEEVSFNVCSQCQKAGQRSSSGRSQVRSQSLGYGCCWITEPPILTVKVNRWYEPRSASAHALRESVATLQSPKGHHAPSLTQHAAGVYASAEELKNSGAAQAVRPNPSVKRSAAGRPPSPRAAVVYPALRGLGVLPSPPAYLER